jgi:hypothetical protein
MTRTCNVCGGETRRGTRYTARCDDKTLVSLPSIECTSCGAIHPDTQRISSLPPEEVPSSVLAEHQVPKQRYTGDTLSPPKAIADRDSKR